MNDEIRPDLHKASARERSFNRARALCAALEYNVSVIVAARGRAILRKLSDVARFVLNTRTEPATARAV